MTPPIRMVSVPVALPLKLIDTLKPLAIVAEKLKHCHVVEVCEPTADNPSRTTIPMPREWFERTADDLEAIAILMHGAGVLSEGQAATLTGLDRVEVRKQVDALTAAPVREEGGAVRQAILDFNVEEYVDGYEFSGDEGFYSPTEDERALLTDAIHGVISELSLATREEAPPLPGQPCEHQPGCDCTVAEEDVARSKPPLRAQPQAREEAQPVAGDWQSVAMWMGFAASVIKSGEPWTDQCQREFDEAKAAFARLSSTPPAPEAEKLRVAVEAIRAEIKTPISGPMHGAWDRGRIAGLKEALSALQQEGR